MSFVGLHIHSDYSLLHGASQIHTPINRSLFGIGYASEAKHRRRAIELKIILFPKD